MLHFGTNRGVGTPIVTPIVTASDGSPFSAGAVPGMLEAAPRRICRRKVFSGLSPSPRPRNPNAYSVVFRVAGETAFGGWLRRASVEADVCLVQNAPRGDGPDDSKSQVWGDGSGHACTVEPLQTAAHSGGGSGRRPFVCSDGKTTAGTGSSVGRQKSAMSGIARSVKGQSGLSVFWFAAVKEKEFRTPLAPSASPMHAVVCRPAAAGGDR